MTETTVFTTTPSTEPVEDDSPVVTVNWSKLGRIAKKSARYALPAAAGFAALCLVKALASSDDDTEETDSLTLSSSTRPTTDTTSTPGPLTRVLGFSFSKGTNMELQTAVVVTLTENGKTVKRTIKKSEQFDEHTSWDHIVKTTKSLAGITLNSIA